MSRRSITLGLLLAIAVCALCYFNNHVALQAPLVGSQLPLLICAALLGLAVLINPLLRLIRGARPLTAAELAVAFALGAVACTFPESGFFRYFSPMVAMPARHEMTRPDWQAQQVLGYVPGSERIAHGQVADWPALAMLVIAPQPMQAAWSERILAESDPGAAAAWRRAASSGWRPTRSDQDLMLGSLNRAVAAARLQGNDDAREQIVTLTQGLVRASPRGTGVLLMNGRWDDRTMDPLIAPTPDDGLPSLTQVPWRAWAAPVLIWGGIALCLSLASLCLAWIVHPQWAQRERLAYPIPRVLSLLFERDHRLLPTVTYRRAFRGAFLVTFAVLGINGLGVWLAQRPVIPLMLDFGAMRQLFPHADRLWAASGLFLPTIVPTAVAFAFFLPRSVSFSFGMATPVFVFAAALLMAQGVMVTAPEAEPGYLSMFTFGGFVAFCATILYSGRRHYLSVLGASIGIGHDDLGREWRMATAFRSMVVLLIAAMALFYAAGLSPALSAVTVGLILMTWLVVGRIVCETGLYRIGFCFAPIAVVTGVLGHEAIGPTGLLIIAIASIIFTTDVGQAVTPFALSALQLTDREKTLRPRLAPAMGLTMITGFAVALVVTLALQYHFGFNTRDEVVYHSRSAAPLTMVQRSVQEMAARGTLSASAFPSDRLHTALIRPQGGAITAAVIGVLVVGATAMARLRVPGWPIHPAMFLVLGNWGLVTLGFSFLLGFAIKAGVLHFGGIRAMQATQPAMAAIIAAGLASAVLWLVVGWVYHLRTGLTPARYVPF